MSSVASFGYFSLVLVLLWVIRSLQTKNFGFYLFMVWNMILAAVPAAIVLLLTENDVTSSLWVLVGATGWLLFLPNAYYLLTDFMHLNSKVAVNQRDDQYTSEMLYSRGDPIYISDSFLLFVTTFFGAVCGGVALVEFHELLQGKWPAIADWVIAGAIFASAVGVYIGRFGRWNSWDAVLKPWAVLTDTIAILTRPVERRRFAIVVAVMILFQVFSVALVTRLY